MDAMKGVTGNGFQVAEAGTFNPRALFMLALHVPTDECPDSPMLSTWLLRRVPLALPPRAPRPSRWSPPLEEITHGSFLPSVRERWHRRWLGVGGPSPPAQRTCTARLYRVRVHACVERGPPDRPVLPLSIAMSAHVAAALVVGDDNVAPQRVLHLRVGYVYGPCAPRDAPIKASKPPF